MEEEKKYEELSVEIYEKFLATFSAILFTRNKNGEEQRT